MGHCELGSASDLAPRLRTTSMRTSTYGHRIRHASPARRMCAALVPLVFRLNNYGPLRARKRVRPGAETSDYIDAHVHVWTPDTARFPRAANVRSAGPASFTPEQLWAIASSEARPTWRRDFGLHRCARPRMDTGYGTLPPRGECAQRWSR